MGFIEGRLSEARLYGNDVFPKTLLPAAGSGRNLAELVAAEGESLAAELRRHRALLFRGFDVGSADDFDRVVEAFGWDTNQEVLGCVNRRRLSERVFTANETLMELKISFHHELSLRKRQPSKILFYCSETSPVGGETSLVGSDVVVDKMEERMPDLMAKVAEVGIVHIFKTFNDDLVETKGVLAFSWKTFLGTDDVEEARKRALKIMLCKEAHLFEDQSAEFTFGPLNPVAECGGGRRAWIVPINGFGDNLNTVDTKFANGDDFPEAAIRTYMDILEENCVDIKWQKGDVLLIDNLVVQHARRPGKKPRCLLASMCN